ncbi:hypothetical protein ACFO0N_21095 [Halobium salinum]|uniref:Uncharacterized protein n=1 Tax=Halobium salinum TaxID=1364940 RepID=A0ABD5PI26_9EURY|nr:hypothetical protein [Halobium salinum]
MSQDIEETVYRSSTGEFVTESQIWARFEAGDWTPCCWDTETGREWVGTTDDELLALSPVDDERLPAYVRLERSERGYVVHSE